MKRFQHLLTVIAVLMALVCCLSVTALAADTSGTCGDNVTWTLDNMGTLTISGIGNMTSAPWKNDYQTVIKKVIIEEGVTSI